jgi:predicted transcriptional regulator
VHDQFLQTMAAGTQASMDRAADVANSNHRMAQDMVDYSLDRQTVLNTNTGQIYKITNQVTVGGALQQVHGDGTP